MFKTMTRRTLLKSGLIATAAVPAFGLMGGAARAAASTLPALDPNDPAAKALGFVTNASTVNAAANPTYKSGQHCASCAQFQGKPGDASGGCNIFAGHSVPMNGWCKAWAQKS